MKLCSRFGHTKSVVEYRKMIEDTLDKVKLVIEGAIGI